MLYRLSDLNKRNLVSQSPRSRHWQVLFLVMTLSLACRWLPSHCLQMAFLCGEQGEQKREKPPPFPIRTAALLDWNLTLMTYFT